MYCTVALAIPVNVRLAEVPEQMEVSPEIATVGMVFTVIKIELLKVALHVLKTEEVQLTSVYVLFAVNAGVVKLAKPLVSNVIDWFAPPSTV